MAAKFHFSIIYPQMHQVCLDVLQMSNAEFCGQDVSRVLGNCLEEALAADCRDKFRSLGLF